MIQIIDYNEPCSLNKPKSFDEFDINIIDIRDINLWRNSDLNSRTDTIDDINDFRSIHSIIENSIKSKTIIIFPQNVYYSYDKYDRNYHSKCELKNMINGFKSILSVMIDEIDFNIVYENTITRIGEKEIEASFYFEACDNEILTQSNGSSKVTTIESNGIILTTLNLNLDESLEPFLKKIHLVKEKVSIPDWIKDLEMFDDQKQYNVVQETKRIIRVSNEKIEEALKIIEKNNEYKSILYSTGHHLEKMVFEILQELLKCDLSDFEDEKEEDFCMKIGEKIFIGEIKGVNHNIKSQNISQLDVHYQNYLDENPDKTEEDIKALLIMAHQKNKSLENREPVHEKQIQLAMRNRSLIIETITLLRLFEKYKNGEISSDDCIELFSKNIGLLKIEDL